MNKPAKFSGDMYGTKVVVEYDSSDIPIDEVMSAFETIVAGLGYHPKSLKQWMIDRVEEYNHTDNRSENNEWDVTLEDGLEDSESEWYEENKTNQAISILKGMEVDGDTMQYILEEVGLDEQMAIQLATKYFNEVEQHLYELESEGVLNTAKPPFVSDDFQIGPDGAYENI